MSSHHQSKHDARISYDYVPSEDFTASTTPLNSTESTSDIEQMDVPSNDSRSDGKHPVLPHPMPKDASRKRLLLNFDWGWEILALALATASIAGIIGVLGYASGKAILEWQFSIQPASLVAIFSTIAKSALLVPLATCLSQLKWSYFEKARTLSRIQDFDDASRGPWGAVVFLWRIKGTALLASVGAMVTLLMLAFEPFTQQVIRFGTRPSVVTASSRHNSTFEYKPGTMARTASLSDWRFSGGAGDSADVRFSMTLAMMAAMAGRPSTYQSNAYCPTAECSFEDFTTLGVCSTCDSEQVLVNDAIGCTYYVRESVPSSSAGNDTVYNELGSFQAAAREALNRDTTVGYGMSCNRTKEAFPTFGFTFDVNVVENTTHPQGLGQRQNQGSETLYPDAIFGETNSTFMGTIDLSPGSTTNNSFHQSRYRFCTSGYGRGDLGGNSADFDTIDTFTCFLTSHDGLSGSALSNLEKLSDFNATLTHCRLSLCAQTYNNISIHDGQANIGSTIKRQLVKSGDLNYYNDTQATAEDLSNFEALIGPKNVAQLASTIELVAYSSSFQEFIKDLVDKTDWPVAFTRIASAASDFIRSADNVDAGVQFGRVHAPESYIQVQWAWLTLPFLMLLMTTAILVCTIVVSRRGLGLYKHSILALILPRLEGGQAVELSTRSGGGGRQTDSELLKSASGLKAGLVRDGDERLVLERRW
ncbi:Nn.00g084000.m01.CDS01 [Neocucurbitaria sp. VM-36]